MTIQVFDATTEEVFEFEPRFDMEPTQFTVFCTNREADACQVLDEAFNALCDLRDYHTSKLAAENTARAYNDPVRKFKITMLIEEVTDEG